MVVRHIEAPAWKRVLMCASASSRLPAALESGGTRPRAPLTLELGIYN